MTDMDFGSLLKSLRARNGMSQRELARDDLGGVHRQAWEAIVVGVATEGVDP